jgi:cobalt-zinc-cadmium efflux system protein
MAHNHGGGDDGHDKLGWALIITALYMVAEAAGGLYFNSLALLADAGHMLSDVMALGLSWVAIKIGKRRPTDRHTFGFRRTEILAAFLNGLGLWIIVGLIVYEAHKRLMNPEPVMAGGMLLIASVGLGVNVFMALLLFRHRESSLNIKSAFIHIIGDALGSVGAIAAAIGIILTSKFWLDPLVSVLVALLILLSSWELVKESVNILLEGVPKGIDISAIEASLIENSSVCCVHDLHVWSISGEKHALAAHVVLNAEADQEELLSRINTTLNEKFGIDHTTIQIEITHNGITGCHTDQCRPGSPCSNANGIRNCDE